MEASEFLNKDMVPFLLLFLPVYVGLVNSEYHVLSSISPNNIFILAGQSNMAGRGGVINQTWDKIVPPQCQPNTSIFRLSAQLSWVKANEPLHKDIDINKTCGVGPGMSFANSILAKDSRLGGIGLVPCAIGGTNISQWRRGTKLYNELVKRVRIALQGGGIIRALLWYQGESDTVNLEDAEKYKGRLEKFFTDLRGDLLSPMLPVIQVALASGEGPYIEMVRDAQLTIDLPNVRCVDAKGLQLEPDNLHLSTPAQIRLGEILANTYLQTIPSPSISNASKRFNNFMLHFFHSLSR